MIPAPSLPNLTPKEIAKLDLRIAGKLIRDRAFHLSHKVNHELMEPISTWLDDKDWMKNFKVTETDFPNWAAYKRNQREWTQQQREILRNRMKMYWQEIHKQRNQRTAVAKLLSESRLRDTDPEALQEPEENKNTMTYTASILSHFSPQAATQRNTIQEFTQSLQASPSNLLPWRVILLTELHESPQHEMTLTDFKTYYNEDKKTDIASKLIHLLQLDTEGAINLSQSAPFEDIKVSTANINSNTNENENFFHRTELLSTQNKKQNPNKDISQDTNINRNIVLTNSTPLSTPEGSDTYSDIRIDIIIKDKEGNVYPAIDWRNLSNSQRNKVVADIKSNHILCNSSFANWERN